MKIAKFLAVLAVAAVALPLAAAETTDAKKAPEASATKAPEGSTQPTQQQLNERTGNETRSLPAPKKMTKEEKAADKKAKRVPPTKEEQDKANKATPGG